VAVVQVPNYEPWIVARWAFRALAERTTTLADTPEDEAQIRQSVALDGLHFNLMEPDQRTRIAIATAAAADQLRSEYRDGSDPRDREFSEALGRLRLTLADLTGE
jgi:hypothetical protein